jgi:hypothetical protein
MMDAERTRMDRQQIVALFFVVLMIGSMLAYGLL